MTILISIRITARGFGVSARPGRPDRPRPTHFDRLGRSESLDELPESPRIASSCSTEPLRATKVDREGRREAPSVNFQRFSFDFGFNFQGFSSLTACALLQSIFRSIFVLFRRSFARVNRLASKGPTLKFIAMGSVS